VKRSLVAAAIVVLAVIAVWRACDSRDSHRVDEVAAVSERRTRAESPRAAAAPRESARWTATNDVCPHPLVPAGVGASWRYRTTAPALSEHSTERVLRVESARRSGEQWRLVWDNEVSGHHTREELGCDGESADEPWNPVIGYERDRSFPVAAIYPDGVATLATVVLHFAGLPTLDGPASGEIRRTTRTMGREVLETALGLLDCVHLRHEDEVAMVSRSLSTRFIDQWLSEGIGLVRAEVRERATDDAMAVDELIEHTAP